LIRSKEERFILFALDRFRRIFPAALTIFDKDNNLNEEDTPRHWDWLITRQGADGLVIAGTSGEFIALNEEGSLRLFRLAQSIVQKWVLVILSSGIAARRSLSRFAKRPRSAERMHCDPFFPLNSAQEKKLFEILEQTGWHYPDQVLELM
jgi:dihydrodipicolinate synthase/N-acetylneuraminate lyase